MTSLRRFWTTLDEVPEAVTDSLDWRTRLGNEWQAASRFLKKTGQLAKAVDCPSPGGDGCPRIVVPRGEGQFRAVCGSDPSACEALDLTTDDVLILELDRPRLLRELGRLFEASHDQDDSGDGRVMQVGRHAVAAGVACSVLLVLPGPLKELSDEELQEGRLTNQQAVLLVPRTSYLSSSLRSRLIAGGHQIIDLTEVVEAGNDGSLRSLQTAAILLAPVRHALRAQLKDKAAQLFWPLPPGARWEEMIWRLRADQSFSVKFRGDTKQIDPAALGMQSKKNGKPTQAWVTLVALARLGGILTIQTPRRKIIQKHIQTLSETLRAAFGIEDPSLQWRAPEQAYQARFVISDDRPLANRR